MVGCGCGANRKRAQARGTDGCGGRLFDEAWGRQAFGEAAGEGGEVKPEGAALLFRFERGAGGEGAGAAAGTAASDVRPDEVDELCDAGRRVPGDLAAHEFAGERADLRNVAGDFRDGATPAERVRGVSASERRGLAGIPVRAA